VIGLGVPGKLVRDRAILVRAMRKIFKILGAFLSFFFVLFGVVSMLLGLEVVSHPFDLNPTWNLYYFDFRDTRDFYIGCGLISAGLVFFWIQRGESD
jgi:hypothetical protein